MLFHSKFDSVPSKIFFFENIFDRQKSISFWLMPLLKSLNLPVDRDGQKTQFFWFDQKIFFFSISLKRIIKRLLKLTNQEIFFFKNKDFFRRFQSIILELQRVGLWSPAFNASVCNFSILILDLWFRKKPEYSFWNH